MGQTDDYAWHQATPQLLEPVGPDRDYGISILLRIRRRCDAIGIPLQSRLTVDTCVKLDRTNLDLSWLG